MPQFDSKAARTLAEGMRDKSSAEAERIRAESELERRTREAELQDASAARRDQQKIDRKRAKLAFKGEKRKAASRQATERWAKVRRAASTVTAGIVGRLPWLIGGIAMGAPILIAWRGQIEFGAAVLGLGALSFLLPTALEGAALYLSYLTHRAIQRRLPSLRYRIWTWVFTAAAAGMNFWHGAEVSPAKGVTLAACSVLGVLQLELTAALNSQMVSQRSFAEIRTELWRWLRYGVLQWQARSIRAALGPACTPDQAWYLAWHDRYGMGPTSTKAERRLGRAILSARKKADRKMAKAGELVIGPDGRILRPKQLAPERVRTADVYDFVGQNEMTRIEDYLRQRFPMIALSHRADASRPAERGRGPRAAANGSMHLPSEQANGQRVPDALNAALLDASKQPHLDASKTPRQESRQPGFDAPRESGRKASKSRRATKLDATKPRGSTRRILPSSTHRANKRRSVEDLRIEFGEALAAGRLDANDLSAEKIRKALSCEWPRGKTLLEEFEANPARFRVPAPRSHQE
ncbi:hypothetical protein GCM10009733_021380 [Nonomuraea maheshkhaliensis]|uniref:DUF2637 domain-containing protein n=1 Tax=Nonomuraea maheshkhaliensis TaxID=419590 RepID=A0ABN2F021_9ACTN